MAGIFQVRGLAARKRKLVAESELYREMMSVEVQNLQLYAAGVKDKLAALRATSTPLLLLAGLVTGMSGLPLGGVLRRRRKRNWLRLGMAAMTGFRIFRNVAPLIQMLLAQRRAAQQAEPAVVAEAKGPAADR